MKIPWGLSRQLSGNNTDVYHGKGPGIDSQTTKQQEKEFIEVTWRMSLEQFLAPVSIWRTLGRIFIFIPILHMSLNQLVTPGRHHAQHPRHQ